MIYKNIYFTIKKNRPPAFQGGRVSTLSEKDRKERLLLLFLLGQLGVVEHFLHVVVVV